MGRFGWLPHGRGTSPVEAFLERVPTDEVVWSGPAPLAPSRSEQPLLFDAPPVSA